MMATISPAECTVAHVFEHIQKLEDQANEELGMAIDYGAFPAPFDMRKTDEGLYEHQRDMKNEYLPVIESALGIRNHVLVDSAEDKALAEAHSLKWYYVAIRPQRDLFTLIKYRSSKPCPSLVLQMAGLTRAYHKHRHDEDYNVFVPCGTLETADVDGMEPQESEAVAKRLWGLATDRGGSSVLLFPKERVDATGIAKTRTPGSRGFACHRTTLRTLTNCGPRPTQLLHSWRRSVRRNPAGRERIRKRHGNWLKWSCVRPSGASRKRHKQRSK